MSLTYGFYNSLNHDRLYNAEDMSRIFDGIINDGIYESIGTAMMVTPSSGMTINVGVGRAWFNHTWTYNDAILPLTIEVSSSVYSRIDAVVLRIDTRRDQRVNSIEIIKGSESLTPTKPDISTGSPEVFQYPLAYITVRRGVVEIAQADIENRVGMSETPFVTGIIQVMSIDALIAQWNDEWQQWLESKPAEFAEYVSNQESAIAAEHAALTAFITDERSEISSEHTAYTAYISQFESDMDNWKAGQESDFENWFETIRGILDGDVAGHLQNEIDEINSNWASLEAELRNDVEEEILASEEQLFNYYYELDNKITTIVNGVITEVSDKATAVTTFTEVSGGKNIVTTITPINDDYRYIKITQIREAYGSKTITESFTKELKEA